MEQITSLKIAATCAQIADERKATDIRVLNLKGLSPVADFFVIVSGRNTRQLRAISLQVQQMAKENGIEVLGVEGKSEANWVLIDLVDVIVHLFLQEARQLYDLELLWGDASIVEWESQETLPYSPVQGSPTFPTF